VSFSICYQHHASNMALQLKDDRDTSNLISLFMEEHIQKLVRTIESYSNRPLFVRAVKDRDAKKAMVHLAGLAKTDPDLDIIVISDKQGTLWAAYPERPEVMGQNFAHREWYKGVSKEWKTYISNAVLRVVREKDVAFQIAVPVTDTSGEVLGIMEGTQCTTGLARLLQRLSLDPGTFVNITDRTGNLLYSSRFAYDKEITPYPFYFVKEKAIAAKTSTVPVEDPYLEKRSRHITYAPIAGIGWSVFVGRDSRTILMSELTYFIQVAVIALLLFMGFSSVLFYFRKQVMVQQLLEQLEADKALRKSEAQLLAILDATPFPIALVDLQNNKIDFWSHSALTLFGHTAPTAAEWYQIAYPDPDYQREVIDRWEPFLEIARKSHQTVNAGEYRVTCSDGSARICELYATFLTDKLMVTFNDITDRKRAEEMLLLSEEKFAKAFQSSPDAFLLTSVPDGRITEVNAGAILLSGYSTEEMLGRTTTELGLWADPAARDAYMAEILREGRAANFETVFRLKSGAIITGLISGGIIQLRDGKCFLSVIRDISDRKRAEVALRQQTEELRASNDELELFNRAATGRELRMIELKQEINELCRRLGEPPRHATDQVQTDSVPGVGPVPAPPGGGGA